MLGGLFRLAMINTIGTILMIYLALSYPALLSDIFAQKTAFGINIFGGMFPRLLTLPIIPLIISSVTAAIAFRKKMKR